MMKKTVKIREDRECVGCGKLSTKGSKMIFESWRNPRYDNHDNQIGINYVKVWFCEDIDSCNVRILAEDGYYKGD